MTHLETPHSFWSEDCWVAYQALFQFTRVNTPGEMTDIGWYTKYLIDGDANEVDLDELVRENERIRVRLSLLTGVEVRRIRWKKIHWRSRRTTTDSSQSFSPKKKREYRPLVRNLRTNKLNQFLKPPGKPMQNAPPSSETLNGFEARLTTGENFEARPPPVVKHLLRPISLRNVHSEEVASRSSGPTLHSHFDEKTVIRYNREHSREEEDVSTKDWHRHNSAEEEADDEAQKSPVAVSDLVSKFESVRRRNAFSYGSSRTTKNFDPYSSLERKKKSSQEENQRRSIRVIKHNNSPPVDQMDSRMDGPSNQSYVNTTHEVHKIPQRSSGVTRSDAPFLRMKSEGHSRVYPAKLGGINTTDQFSRSPSEPKPLQKGYSFDSGFRIQHHPVVHHDNNPPPLILTNDHLVTPVVVVAATTTTTHNNNNNHISVVTKLPAIRVDGTNIRRTHSASKGDEPPFHKISSRSSFNKNPDAARQITCSVIPETDPVPSWKSEVEIRKRTKSYVSSHKPEQPMQLGSVPEWKKLLLEKNKQKRSSTEIHHDLSNTRVTKPDTTINYTEPAWKLEFEKIKRQVHATHQSNHYAANVFDREVPEWVKLAEQRRQSKPFSENEEA